MSTPRQILGQAYATSKKNRGSSDIDEATEGVAVVQGALDRLYTVAARVNPEYFGEVLAVTLFNGQWPIPERAERVWRLENPATGKEVTPVGVEDRALFSGRRSTVYFLGRAYRPTGNPGDILSGDLNFFYSKGAPAITIDQELSPDVWPVTHEKLLVYESAAYIALKDARSGADLPDLLRERNSRAILFVAHCEHVASNVVRRTGTIPRSPAFVIQDVLALLAGGTAAPA